MQQDTKQQRVRRGYALVAGLLLAAVLIFNLDVIADRIRGYVDVVALVRETSGVRVGSAVLVEGVEAGRVREIELLGGGAPAPVAMHIRLNDRVRPVVREGSRAYTDKRRFIGEPLVRIDAGPADAPALAEGDTIYPSDRPNLEALLEKGEAFPPALDSLNRALQRLQGLVEGRQPALTTLVDRLAVATEEAGALRRQLEGGSLNQLLDDPTLGARIAALRQHADSLAGAAAALRRYGGDADLAGRIRSVTHRADRLEEELQRLAERLEAGDGMLARARQDSALQRAITGVTAQIDSLRAAGLGFALRMFLP